jgi:hypothetical protein
MPTHPKIHVVRYEDLHAAPEATFAKLLSFLGLKPEPGQLEAAARFSMFNVLSEQGKRAGFVDRPARGAFFRRGRPGEGREALKPAQIDALVNVHREQMARFGYTP